MSICSICDFVGAPTYEMSLFQQFVYMVLVGAFKSTILVLIFAFLKKYGVNWLGIIFVVVYSCISLSNAYSFTFYGFGLSRKLITVLMETTPEETIQFLPTVYYNLVSSSLNYKFYIGILFLSCFFLVFKCLSSKMANALICIVSLGGCVLFIIFAFSFTSGRTAHSLILRGVKYTCETVKYNKAYEELLKSATPFPDVETVSSEKFASNVVIVIGESASKEHLALYGYPLPTSPWSEAMRDSLFVFSDAVASSSNTSGNMERVLSFKTDDKTYGDGLNYPSIIDLFNAAKYNTLWISNQEKSGSVLNTSSIFNRNAKFIKYIGAECSEDAMLYRYDEDILPVFRNVMDDKKSDKIVFLHLYGSHTKYKYRYPKEQDVITPNMEINAPMMRPWLNKQSAIIVSQYDNSIRYTDSILSQIINIVANEKKPSIMIYFSDHGECVYDEGDYISRGHNSVRVPFIIYANAAYRDSMPEMIEKIIAAENLPFSTANVIHSIMTLTGTKYSWYEDSLDVLSPKFVRRHRNVDEEPWPYD